MEISENFKQCKTLHLHPSVILIRVLFELENQSSQREECIFRILFSYFTSKASFQVIQILFEQICEQEVALVNSYFLISFFESFPVLIPPNLFGICAGVHL